MDRFTNLIKLLEKHMSENPSIECCGIITKSFDYVPCRNLSPSPKESFILDPVMLLKHADDCWGIFHSHPLNYDELPSEKDKMSAIYKNYKFVVGNLEGKFYQYWIDSLNYLRFKEFNKESLGLVSNT